MSHGKPTFTPVTPWKALGPFGRFFRVLRILLGICLAAGATVSAIFPFFMISKAKDASEVAAWLFDVAVSVLFAIGTGRLLIWRPVRPDVPGNEEGSKLGSENDSIRQMLFASQSIKEQVSRIRLDGKPSAFQTIANASALIDAGKKDEAIQVLRTILKNPELETRIELWTWTALRELGEKPEPAAAYEVMGAVMEVPSGGSYDTLAAYADGSSRYLNFSGRAIFWDAPDATIKGMCRAFIQSTTSVGNLAKPRTTLSLPKGETQVTLLTRSGIYTVSNPPNPVMGAATALMLELINRAKEKQTEL